MTAVIARPRTRPLTRVYVTGISCAVLAGLNAALPQPHDVIGWVLRGAPYVSAILWVDIDARSRGLRIVQDWGLFAYIGGWMLIPWYAWKTRGPHGWWIAVFLVIPILLPTLTVAVVRFTVPYALPSGTDVFSMAAGTWGLSGVYDCAHNRHVITFSPDHQMMTVTFRGTVRSAGRTSADTILRYAILSIHGGTIREQMVGETRHTPSGDTLTWDLVLSSPSTYYWHRNDAPFYWRTSARVRCP